MEARAAIREKSYPEPMRGGSPGFRISWLTVLPCATAHTESYDAGRTSLRHGDFPGSRKSWGVGAYAPDPSKKYCPEV